MKFNLSQSIKEKILTYSISGIIIVGFYLFIKNIDPLYDAINNLFVITMPFILGFSLSFLLSGMVEKIEKGLFKKLRFSDGAKRKFAVAISMTIFVVCLISFVTLLGTQLALSIQTFVNSFSDYIVDSAAYFTELLSEVEFINDFVVWANSFIRDNLLNAVDLIREQMPVFIGYSWSLMTSFVNLFIAIVVAVYILLDKERFYLGTKQFTYAILPKSKADWLVELTYIASKMFRQFIVGKAIDSLIIGILCYIGMTLLKIDFTLLISFIIGVTNMIPFFGPFIGAIPATLILLIANPQDSFIFVIWILILQQFDGNILGPKILGDSLGLPKLWVLFAIIVGGAMFGLIGMFLGVPIFATIYYIVRLYVLNRLKRKEIEIK